MNNVIVTKAINSSVSVGTSSTAVLTENNSRIGLTISNTSDTDIYLSFGGDAVLGEGTYLKANGGSLTLDNALICTLSINAISSVADKSLSFTEFLNQVA